MNNKYAFELSFDEMLAYIETHTFDSFDEKENEENIIEDYTSFALYQ